MTDPFRLSLLPGRPVTATMTPTRANLPSAGSLRERGRRDAHEASRHHLFLYASVDLSQPAKTL